jgi:hypothetical protein
MQTAARTSPRARTWYTLAAVTALIGGIASATHDDDVATGPTTVHEVATAQVTTTIERSTTRATPIEIVGVAKRRRITADDELPLTFYAVNHTNQSLPVLRSLDASDMGWRYPKIEIEIRDANGSVVGPGSLGRCGLVNPLAAKDFVELASGARVDLLGEDSFRHHRLRHPNGLPPGTYTVTMRYDISFAKAERKSTQHDATVRALIERLPRGVYTSAPITIEVE